MESNETLEMGLEGICFVLMPDDRSTMTVFYEIEDAEKAVQKLLSSTGVSYQIYPGLLDPTFV